MTRVLAIGLDGFEESLGRQLMASGDMPYLARLRTQSAQFLLDHGPAQRTGLAWEHASTGLSPRAADRWAAVHFDPNRYTAWQEGTKLRPFPADLRARTVVFDPPYFDLDQAPRVQGLVNWGAHDPGVPHGGRPADLVSECHARFGPYPAKAWIYGCAWPSAVHSATMGAALTRAVEVRSQAARWLLAERLPAWDLGMVVVSEPHSAIEALWHGIDKSHPLHHLPSAGPAGEGLISVYRAVDRLVGDLAEAFPDAALLIFSMGGMGPNRSDVPSMILLPELMHRRAFGRAYLRQPPSWSAAEGGYPLLGEGQEWSEAVRATLPALQPPLFRRVASRLLPAPVKRALRRAAQGHDAGDARPLRLSLDWMPASVYQPHWRRMDAFALPSYYDGRIRVNLQGRERYGRVAVPDYHRTCDAIETLLRECRDRETGDSVVDFIERPAHANPLDLGPTESDLVVVWKGCVSGLTHPTLGTIGPIPLRRSGGHTGPFGLAYLKSSGVAADDRGIRSSFDVVPTIIELLGESVPPGISGGGLLV
jgi:predicted AlkP superfamily phosphohydrolase/phosphomutase